MPDTAFAARVNPNSGGTVIALSGDVNRTAEEGLARAYREAVAHPGDIALDFTDTAFINSTGIALIVGLLAKARADGRAVSAYGLSEHYREVFRITRLADFMTIHDEEARA